MRQSHRQGSYSKNKNCFYDDSLFSVYDDSREEAIREAVCLQCEYKMRIEMRLKF